MKKTLAIFALAVIFLACKNTTNGPENKNMVLVDTTGLSENMILIAVGNNKYVVAEKPVEATRKTANKSSGNNKSNANYSSGTNTTANASYPQDKGWSHAAKGTAVGAGTGAITGAILNKDDRGKGAIIGTVIGAGAGYVIGRATDKKTGRVDRAKAKKAANQ